MIELQVDAPQYLDDLVRLNEIWIREHFQVEEMDEHLARDPSAVFRNGGHTLTALIDGQVVGVVALFAGDPGEFELSRLAVAPERRGQGIGRRLVESALELARKKGARRVFLLSNKGLVPALQLYRSLGFSVVREGPHPKYSRCDVVMEKWLGDG